MIYICLLIIGILVYLFIGVLIGLFICDDDVGGEIFFMFFWPGMLPIIAAAWLAHTTYNWIEEKMECRAERKRKEKKG